MALNDRAEKTTQARIWIATEPEDSVKHRAAREYLAGLEAMERAGRCYLVYCCIPRCPGHPHASETCARHAA